MYTICASPSLSTTSSSGRLLRTSRTKANSEQLFSRAGTLADDNGKMDPHRRAVWTSIGVNYSTYKPTDEEILTRYLLKFSKGGKATAAELHQDDLGLLDPSGDSEGYLVQAASGAIEL